MTRGVCVVLIGTLALGSLVAAQGRQGQGRGGGQAGGRRGGGPAGDVFLTEVPPHAIDVVLARPTATSITISAMAAATVDATLTVEPGGVSMPLALRAGLPAEAEVQTLRANQAYRYTIAAGGNTLASGSFHTARPAGAPFVFDLQADSHLDGNTDPRVYTNTIRNMLADRADFMVDLGDTFMTDKYPAYQDAARQYIAQRYYFGLMGAGLPAFLALGNHDGETATRPEMTAWSSAMRKRYFPPVVTNAFYTAGPTALDYYAWTWGDAQFIVLDPFNDTRQRPRDDADGWAWTLGKTQYDWLTATLAASQAKHRFVFIHHLVGGGTREGRGGAEASVFFEWGGKNRDTTPGWAQHRAGWALPIHDLLVKHHVTAVFHGHDHLYVRQERHGLIYLEVPQPSHARGDQTNTAQAYGYLSGTLLGSSGHVRVSVNAATATLEYVKSRLTGRNAEVVDAVTVTSSGGRR